jgi:hypothetical protein
VAIAQDGEIVGRVMFPEGEGFSIALDPGTYRLDAFSGDVRCPDTTVTVLVERYEIVRIRCSVK